MARPYKPSSWVPLFDYPGNSTTFPYRFRTKLRSPEFFHLPRLGWIVLMVEHLVDAIHYDHLLD